MPETAIQTAQLAGSASHDLSMLGLFLQADIVVKLVMLLLMFLSVWCWAIILQKNGRLKSLARRADKFEEAFWSGDPLDKLYERVSKQSKNDPMLKIFSTGMDEWRTETKSGPKTGDAKAGAMDRVESLIRVAARKELRALQTGFSVLASTASMAAFIGLFGTVWGIVRSFTAIAAMQNTSLAVVAPGIAEALYATGVGLFAALTGMGGINILRAKLSVYSQRMDEFVTEFITILKRYSDR